MECAILILANLVWTYKLSGGRSRLVCVLGMD